MDAMQNFHQKWIKKIAKRSSLKRIKSHIFHHVKELNNPSKNEPVLWASSMYNLLSIYESVHKIKPNKKVQISRLLHKYNKNPRVYTSPPGNKIPKNIKL